MEHGTSSRIRILLVDSDIRTARLLARMLREDGFDVEVATDANTAIQRLSRSPVPDVVVTDPGMAQPSGIAVARYARSRRPNLPVVFVTERPQLTQGACRVLRPEPRVFTKPLDYAAFRQELSRMVAALQAA
jgi:CheY-like chemotaxis protein